MSSRLRASVGPARAVVPGPGLPEGLPVGRSNNNLDVAWHDGRLWLAFRTAPTHFASERAVLHVLVSDDAGLTWAHDETVACGRDVREPRLVSWKGRLLLFWFTAGTSAARFEPDRIHVSVRDGSGPPSAGGPGPPASSDSPGRWTPPRALSPPDCVVWRVRPVAGRLAMTLYRGAGSLFTARPVPLTVELWGSDDGLAWEPWSATSPVVHEGGTETEFAELGDGSLLAVVRKEGPNGGFGSDICRSAVPRAPDDLDAITDWRARSDPRKFDSPLLFLDRGVPVLVTRRQLAFGGRFDVAPAMLPRGARTHLNQLAYWLTPKRTALYAIDTDLLDATWICDLPSAGDTAFAGEVPLPGRSDSGGPLHLVFNYSSPPAHGWWPWMVGQLRPTRIEAFEISFEH